MINDFLENQINEIQNDYCDLLKISLDNIDNGDFYLTLDEINLFWYSNREIVKLILTTISKEHECYTFTGASFLDIDDNEHFPFVALGEIHVVDDPLNKFIQAPHDIENEFFNTKLKEQVIHTIKDNIQIIDKYSNAILIFPVTLLTDISSSLILHAAEQAFISMFKDSKLTINKYLSDFNSIEDVIAALDGGALNTIIFSENDDLSINLSIRFREFINEVHPFDNRLKESELFFALVNGFFAQAFNIIYTCSEYHMVPYIRYDLIYRYTVLLGSNFIGNEEMERLLFSMSCAHLLYMNFDKENISKIDFNDYLTRIRSSGFSHTVFDKLEELGFTVKNFSAKDVYNIIQNEFSKILS